MKFSKLTSALFVASALTITCAPMSAAVAAPDAAKIAERKARKTQVMSEKTGKQVAKAFELYSQEKANEAIALLEQLDPKEDFDRAYLWRFLGQLYLDKDQTKALQLMEKAVKLDVLGFKDQADLLRASGDLNMMAEKFDRAIGYYEQWKNFTGEQDGEVEFRIANAYYRLKQFAKIIAPADRAIELAKKLKSDPYELKFAAYIELKQNKKAIEVSETLVTLFPAEKRFWVQLGQMYAMDERYDRALSLLELAYKEGLLKTENEIKLLAQLYNNNELPYRAAALLEKHVNAGLIKKDRASLKAIASAYGAAREFDKAAKFYAILGDLEGDGDSYRLQGFNLLMANRNAEAVTALNKALEKGVKERGKVHVDLISAYFYQGKMREAHQQVQLARQNGQEKVANSWGPYVKERAEKKGIKL